MSGLVLLLSHTHTHTHTHTRTHTQLMLATDLGSSAFCINDRKTVITVIVIMLPECFHITEQIELSETLLSAGSEYFCVLQYSLYWIVVIGQETRDEVV